MKAIIEKEFESQNDDSENESAPVAVPVPVQVTPLNNYYNGNLNTPAFNSNNNNETENEVEDPIRSHQKSDKMSSISKFEDIVSVRMNLETHKLSETDGDETEAEEEEEQEGEESFHNEAHHVFLRLKNRMTRRIKVRGSKKEGGPDGGGKEGGDDRGNILLKAVAALFQIMLDWVIDLVIALYHFSGGRTYVGALTLGFVFVGGAFVNFNLNFLMLRKGDKKFKAELRRCSPVFPYIMHIPSFLPFFSTGLNLHTARKLKNEKDPVTVKKLERLMKVCDEHIVTDLLYESSYEAFPQAILQTVILMEKASYSNLIDFLPMLGVISGWYGISMTPIKMSKSLNNLNVTTMEVLAGLANKGVTLLSFSMFITASRQYFADPQNTDADLLLSTILACVALTFVSDLPGIVSFQLEMRLRRRRRDKMTRVEDPSPNPNPKPRDLDRDRDRDRGGSDVDSRDLKVRRVKSDWECVVSLISLLIPLTSITFWMVTLGEKGDLWGSTRVMVLCPLFVFGFCLAFVGFCCNQSLPWLAQFSTDILLLLFIGFQSKCTGETFSDMDFQYEPQEKVDATQDPDPPPPPPIRVN